MGGVGAVVFDDLPAAARFRSRLESLAGGGDLVLRDLAILQRRPDERLTLELQRGSHGTFWGLLVGLLLWPRWLGATTNMVDETTAKLDRWRLTPDWAEAVARSVGPGDVAVLFLFDDLPEDLFAAVRDTEGDLFPMYLTDTTRATLTDTFGGVPSHG